MDSDWTELPKHLLDSILKRLISLPDYCSLSNYYRFSVVCMSWHCVAKENYNQRPKLSSSHQPPMLLIPTDKEDTWNIYNIMENKVLDLQLRVPKKRFCGSSKGWLITVEENFEVTLVNPFSRVKGREEKKNSIIRLPPINPPTQRERIGWVRKCDYWVYKATILADPILNANDCIIVVIYEDRCQMAFIRLNKDTTWTYVDNKGLRLIDEVVRVDSVEDKIYVVDGWSKLKSFEFTSMDVKLVVRKHDVDYMVKRYLVDLNDKDLWMVHRYINDEDGNFVTEKFEVFEVNFNERKWIKKSTLGDIALFVGDNSTISIVASHFSGYLQPNYIYFNHDNQRVKYEDVQSHGPYDFGVYDLKNQILLEPYNTNTKTLIQMARRPPIWVIPTFQASY